jgi:hypothetical protein
MKKIKLTQNKFALVSDIDYAYLNQFKWYSLHIRDVFYAVRKVNKKTILMHRVILERMGFTNFKQGDHRDRNSLNDQRRNLRVATHGENQQNKNKQCNNTSGYKGVIWDRVHGKWLARIKVGGLVKCAGSFTNKLDAAKAYNDAAKKYHKEFARLNPV